MLFGFAVLGSNTLTDNIVVENSNYIPESLNISVEQFSQLVGGGPVYLRALLQLFVVGGLIDVVNNSHLLVSSMVIAALSTLGMAVASSYGAWLSLRFLYNISAAPAFGLALNVVLTRTPPAFHALASACILAS
eukprot:4876422-Prymnesium_polylepis.1